jgi:hypothetical protein
MSMEVLNYSGSDLQQEFSGCGTLGEVVSELEKKLRARGRVVCHISVNGMRFSEADEQRLAETAVTDLTRLTIECERPENLVQSTIRSQIQLCGELQRVALQTAEIFRKLDLHPAQSHLISLLDGCRWFTDGLAALKAAPPEILPEAFDQKRWDGNEAEFAKAVKEVLTAVENRDYVLIADLLEYDVGNALDRWRDLLGALLKC